MVYSIKPTSLKLVNVAEVSNLVNENSIHAFHWFEEEGHVEQFQCHFSYFEIWHLNDYNWTRA